MTTHETEHAFVLQQMLAHPLPQEMWTVLDKAVRHYPTVSILQCCFVSGDSELGWRAELSYTVFIPLLGSNSCIVQYFHNTVDLHGDGTLEDENSFKHDPLETSLPKAREEWDSCVRDGWRTYLKNAVVS